MKSWLKDLSLVWTLVVISLSITTTILKSKSNKNSYLHKHLHTMQHIARKKEAYIWWGCSKLLFFFYVPRPHISMTIMCPLQQKMDIGPNEAPTAKGWESLRSRPSSHESSTGNPRSTQHLVEQKPIINKFIRSSYRSELCSMYQEELGW